MDNRSKNVRKPIKKKKQKGGIKKIFTKIMVILLVIVVLIGSAVGGAMLGFIDNSTDLIAQEYNLDFTSMVYYVDESTGQPVELDRLYSEQNRIWVDIENTPPLLRDAFVAIEDERFDSHNGVDLKRTLAATFTYLFKGNDSFGGSTITQQLIKNVTGDNKRSPIRKIQEMVRAINLEQKMSKDEIIEMYMNTIYLGQGCHGVQTASNVYFSKDVSQLTLAECASLAGITQYPSKYDPLLNYEEHKKKQEVVLDKMYELGFITEQECQEAKATELRLIKGTAKTEKSKVQSYFVDQVVIDVMNDLMTKKDMSESDATKMLFKGGLKIYTTMDPKVQTAMENVYSNESNFAGTSATNGPQSAMIVIDPYTGHIKGLVGGRGEKTGNRVLNRATQTVRQPGSSIKPLSVYAPAIEYGVVTPSTIVDDSKITIGDWTPKNSDNKFLGRITVRKALEMSRNIPVVRILDKLGVDKSFDFLTKNLGITTLVAGEKREDGVTYSDKYYSSLGLGGFTDGISVKEIAAGYCPFVNSGIYTKPVSYTKVIDPSGRIILENKPETHKAMSPETAYSMANMMTGVITSGTGTGARLKDSSIMAGGKTGTTSNDVDRWFAGFTPNYVGVVWFGYDMPKNMSGLGNPCVSIWKKVMDDVHEGITVKNIPVPKNMVSKRICQYSGKMASGRCSNSRIEYFKAGTQPASFCTSHSYVSRENDLDDQIRNETTAIGETAPGAGTVNPPAEGDIITSPETANPEGNAGTQTPMEVVPMDPAPMDPAPMDPVPVDPAPVDPAPVDPAPVDPAPVNPAPPVSEGGGEGNLDMFWTGE